MSADLYWIAYDLSDNRERTKTVRVAKRYGMRLQKSVFACVLDKRKLRRLRTEMESLQLRSGFVAIVRIAENSPFVALGNVPPGIDERGIYAFVM